MRLVAAIVIAGAVAAPASAAQLMVVGRSGTLLGPRTVHAGAQHVRVGGHRCTVGARTPLATLLAMRLRVSLRDYGACGKRASAANSLYVAAVAGQRERGRDGWVYKIGTSTPSVGAGDESTRTRGRVLWFWCHSGANGCQRSLGVRVARSGAKLTVTVTAYDDHGKGIPATALVHAGTATARAGRGGVATLRAPRRVRVWASQTGRVRSFARRS